MFNEEFCHACGQSMPPKYSIWQILSQHLEGCTVEFIVCMAGYSRVVVRNGLIELTNEGKAYFERGKWYPEMAVS